MSLNHAIFLTVLCIAMTPSTSALTTLSIKPNCKTSDSRDKIRTLSLRDEEFSLLLKEYRDYFAENTRMLSILDLEYIVKPYKFNSAHKDYTDFKTYMAARLEISVLQQIEMHPHGEYIYDMERTIRNLILMKAYFLLMITILLAAKNFKTSVTNPVDAHSLSSDNVDNLSTHPSDFSISTVSVRNHDLSDVDSRLLSRLPPATMSRTSVTNPVDAHSLSRDNVDNRSTHPSDFSISTVSVRKHDLSDVDSRLLSRLPPATMSRTRVTNPVDAHSHSSDNVDNRSTHPSDFSISTGSVRNHDLSDVDSRLLSRLPPATMVQTSVTNPVDAHSLSSDNVDNRSTHPSDFSISTGSVSDHDLSDDDSNSSSSDCSYFKRVSLTDHDYSEVDTISDDSQDDVSDDSQDEGIEVDKELSDEQEILD